MLSPLTIIVDAESCPLFYSHYVNPSITITEKVETITRVIKSNMRLHENESTDVCYIALWFVVIEGKLLLGPSVSVIGDALTEYHKYNHADEVMRMYRPSIRSTFQAVSQIDRNLEFCEKCWKKLADITPCNPLILQYEKKGEDFMEYYADAKKVIEFIQATNEDKKLDKRYEVCMGIVMYIFKLYCEIVDNNLLCQISGRIIFRTMVENYFNLKYLLLKEQDEPRIYEMFQEYGRGKYKLVMSKLREGKFQVEECSHMSKTIMEAYVNEDKDENFLNISLNFFDKQNLRNKVQYMDEEELYEIYYEYDTNYVHGFWGAIREASMLICDNPAHLYHTVPDYSNEQHLYTVEDDCSMLMRKVFKLLSSIVELPDFYLQKYRE